MFNTLLVALDGTPEAAVALPLARTLAHACQGQLLLVRVASGKHSRVTAEDTQYLASVAAELAENSATLTVSTEVRSGEVAAELIGAVYEHNADLVVMATHGRQGLQRAVMGSVAESMLKQSPVPVLLVRPGGKQTTALRTLLVPVDGTPGGALALGSAVALARAAHARIVLLQVTVPIPVWMFGAEFGAAAAAPVDPSWGDNALQSAQTYVEGLAKRLGEGGIQAEGHARIGEVPPTIEAVADEVGADLIVMSTRGLVGPARAVIGSMADAVVRTAHRPVLLVRRATNAGVALDAASPAQPAAVG